MRKKLFGLISLSFLALILGACNSSKPVDGGGDGGDNPPVDPVKTTYTVAFEVEGQRYKTLKVKEGEKITETVADPTKEGFEFVGWYEGSELIDLSTYVVTKNVTFEAHFEEVQDEDVLSVDDVKEDGQKYYLVLGWWETTDMEDDGETPKKTSHLTRDTVRLFYGNVIKYLLATGASEDDIANIQFRNYSTSKVAEMGEKINADGDVDIVIGVGNNINSQAGCSLYEGSNDYKFQTPMGDGTARYVACLASASELGVSTYNWLKNTDAGIKSFLAALTDKEIEDSLGEPEINLTVTFHGDTDVTVLLDDADKTITVPAITIPEGQMFLGFALTQDGEVVLNKSAGDELKYSDFRALLSEGQTTIEFYPVFEDIPVTENYVVIGWYAKESTSGLSQDLMDNYLKILKTYLAGEGVSQDELDTIIFRAYTGNVGPATDEILADGDVDILMGFGSLDNITTTGHIPAANVKESVEFPVLYNGNVKTRYLHRLTATENCIKVMEYLKGAETAEFFNPTAE